MPTVVTPTQDSSTAPVSNVDGSNVVASNVPQVTITSVSASAPPSSAAVTSQGSPVPTAVADPATAPQISAVSPAASSVSASASNSVSPQMLPGDANKSVDPNVQADVSATPLPQVAATVPKEDHPLQSVTEGDPSKLANPNMQASLPNADQGGVSIAPDQPNPWWISFSAHFPQVAQFLESGSLAMVIKGLCMASNIVVQVSPYTQVRRWEMKGDTGEADAAPFVSIGFSGWQWCFYGIFAWLLTKRNGFLILVHSNFLGALLGTYYTITFCRYCRNKACSDSLQRYLSASMTLALLQVCALFVLPSDRALFLSGLVSSFCSFVGAASMLVMLPPVFKSKDSSLIPGPFAVASLGSSLVWVLCGWMLDDPLVIGPNVFATFASLVTLYCKWQYPSIAVKDGKDSLECTDPFEAAIAQENVSHASAAFTRKPPSRSPSLPQVLEGANALLSGSTPAIEPKTVDESQVDSSTISIEDETTTPEVAITSETVLSIPTVIEPNSSLVGDGTGGTF